MTKPEAPQAPKKPYREPELRLYGDLGSLTEASAMGMKFDGMFSYGPFKALMS